MLFHLLILQAFFYLHIEHNIVNHLQVLDLLDYLDIHQDILKIIILHIFIVFNDKVMIFYSSFMILIHNQLLVQ